MSTDEIIQKVIKVINANTDIDILWLYGSRANNTAAPNSDYDFAVAFRNPSAGSIKTQSLRAEDLALTLKQVLQVSDDCLSVVDINRAPTPLAYEIISCDKVLVVKDTLRLGQEEARIWSMYELNEVYHRKHYDN